MSELEEIESRLKSLDWMIALLYDAQRPLIAERNALRAREARAREKALRQARDYLGPGVSEVAG